MPYYLFYVVTLLFSCLFTGTTLFGQEEIAPYDFSQPALSFTLSEELEEISGLSLAADGYHLLAVQDETGRVYQLSPTDGQITASWDFWKDGDYEGIEHCGAGTFVVKSTGTLYWIDQLGAAEQQTTKYNAFLNADNDVEGLACLPAQGKLLIACKASPGEHLNGEEVKAIYAFDLHTRQLEQEPLLLLRRDAVQRYLNSCNQGPNHEKICSIFARDKTDFDLKIAALAVHPISGELYLTSAKGNLLIRVNTRGDILAIYKLPKALHRQPEGLCFDAAGNLYIANEARKDDGPLIHRYTYDPNRP